jgi:hypothetical protein
MYRILTLCTLAVTGSLASYSTNPMYTLSRESQASLQALPQKQQNSQNCTRDSLDLLSIQYQPGEVFNCRQDRQEWECVVKTQGFRCRVKGEWIAEPADLNTSIKLTTE